MDNAVRDNASVPCLDAVTWKDFCDVCGVCKRGVAPQEDRCGMCGMCE